MTQPLPRVLLWLAVAALYFLLGWGGLHWAVLQENTSVIWPATGLSIAAVLRFGYGVWPGIFLGSVAVVFSTSAPWPAALTMGLGNTLEAVVGVWLFRRLAGPGEPLHHLNHTLRFMAASMLAGPLCSAGFGLLALGLFVGVPLAALPGVGLTWWLGNVVGALVLAPLLLSLTEPPGTGAAPGRLSEWLGMVVAMLIVSSVAFGLSSLLPDTDYPLAFLPLPIMVWAALRLGQRGGSLAMLVLAVVAVHATAQGAGSFAAPTIMESYWLLLSYLIISAATMLMVMAVIRERVEQRAALARSRDELELRVAERTQELRDSEARLSLLVTEAPIILWSLDGAGRITLVRGQGLEVLGLDSEALLGRKPEEVFPDDPHVPYVLDRVLSGEPIRTSLALGGRVLELHSLPLRGNGGTGGAIGVCMDITERAQAEERLRLDATVFANTSEGVMITDARGRILTVNAAFSEITGYQEAEVRSREPRHLAADRHDRAFFRHILQTLAREGRWQGEVWNRRRNGETVPIWLTVSAVRDEFGAPSHYVVVFSDISSLKYSQQQLDYLAYHDPLTGLPNRLLFKERLAHALQRAERDQKPLALLFFDLDHFKHVNDSLGHPVGDELLVQLAGRLTETMRGEDTVARLGGDEFVVLAEAIQGAEGAALVAGKLLEACARPFDLAGRAIYLGASVGISLYPQDGTDPDHLVRNADAALYLAKGEGRNTFRFYTGELTHQALQRVELETELRHALAAEEFELHYQPQLCLSTGQVLAVEALLRWRHPQRGLLPPGAFMQVAEASGLIVPMGAWVLKAACRQMAAWLDQGYALEQMAVNLSGQQFEREGLSEDVRSALAEAGLSPYFLELEVTEGALALDRAEAVLRELKALGLRISVDDFGTGFSSMSYLKRLPLDGLKIDRAFIQACDRDAANAAIIQAVQVLGQGLQLSVVAEGVETEAEHEVVKALGCEAVQGYHYARPAPAGEVERHFVRCERPAARLTS